MEEDEKALVERLEREMPDQLGKFLEEIKDLSQGYHIGDDDVGGVTDADINIFCLENKTYIKKNILGEKGGGAEFLSGLSLDAGEKNLYPFLSLEFELLKDQDIDWNRIKLKIEILKYLKLKHSELTWDEYVDTKRQKRCVDAQSHKVQLWEKLAKFSTLKNVLRFPIYANNVEFPGIVEFDSIDFESDVVFKKCVFNRHVFFSSSTFKKDVNFAESKAKKEISFYGTEFNKVSIFRDCKFEDKVFFTNSKFDRGLVLSNAVFSITPDFSNCLSAHAPNLSELIIVNAQVKKAGYLGEQQILKLFRFVDSASSDGLYHTYSKLRQFSEQQNDYVAKSYYYALEVKSRRFWVDKPWSSFLPIKNDDKETRKKVDISLNQGGVTRFWIGLCYGLLSDYGQSILRPLMLLILQFVFFGLIYFSYLPSLNSQITSDRYFQSCSSQWFIAFNQSVRNSFFGVLDINQSKENKGIECFTAVHIDVGAKEFILTKIKIIALLQRILAAVSLFLIGLGVRNSIRLSG